MIARERMKHLHSCSLLLLVLHLLTGIRAQPATAPTPAGPTNITAILAKAGQFTTLIRLLKSTRLGDQINNQLNNSKAGLTIFAPTDAAFSGLSPGTLNSLTDQQKVALVQFHVLPTFISIPEFQTVSNPLRTQAGNANNGQYPLNVTTMGNQVNITTGVVNTTISNTLYSDSQLAVYQVDMVLIPLEIFRPSVAAAAAAPSGSSVKNATAPSQGTSTDTPDASAAVGLDNWSASGVILFGAAVSRFW